MTQVTVKQLAEVVGTPVDRLIEQLKEAGITVTDPDAKVSDDEKMQLLDHLRQSHGKREGEGKKITLRRKSTSELKVTGAQGRAKTVNVEVRKKRTYVKRAALEDQEAQTTSTVPAPSRTEELARTLEAERKAVQAVKEAAVQEEQDRKNAEIARAEEEIARAKAEQDALEKAQEEAAALARAEEESARAASAPPAPVEAQVASPAVADVVAPVSEDKPKEAAKDAKGKRGKGKSRNDENTRYGRKELHVSSDKSGRRRKKSKGQSPVVQTGKHGFERPTAPVVREVEVPETITVGDLAQRMALKATEVIKTLMGMGVMATINQVLDQDTSTLIVEELGHVVKLKQGADAESELAAPTEENDPRETQARPPVVTIMGHVDHGKTSLLDYIRKSKVTSGEAGGITQHIGAYSVTTDKGVVAFLDTPGHAAFTSMRARGAQVTDIVVLVVAADDGVMPQTIEAIEHSKAAGVPIVVAVNKIDKPEADPERVKTELSNHGIISEAWGGDTIFVNVSAKTGEGVDELLTALLLQAEVMELAAPVEGVASGVVIESSLDKGRGPVATILVQKGTLNKSDIILCGQEFGRVRAIFDEHGKQIQTAGPSTPAVILGLSGTPNAGDDMLVVPDERKAREVAMFRQGKFRESRFATQQAAKLDSVMRQMKDGETSLLNIMLKADVQGSAEALRDSLEKLSTDEVAVKIVSAGVGGINESDINLALASSAIVFGFNVRADASARRTAADAGVDLRYYSVIYDVIDDVRSALSGMLSPEMREDITGLAEVKDVFKSSAFGAVAGCLVIEGAVKRGNPIRVLRENVVVYEGELESLRRHRDDVDEVRMGTECGIAVRNYNDVRPGDQIEVFVRTEVARTI